MASVVMGYKAGEWLCRTLGVDPTSVVNIELRCPVNDCATVVVTRVIYGELPEEVQQVYRLAELD